MPKVDILGVKVDQVNMAQAVEQVERWLASQGESLQGRYIVTPNVEFVMAAQQDSEFKKILNQADLAIPDSARFGWAYNQLQEKNWFLKLVRWPLFLFPQLFHFDVVTGTDLMGELIRLAAKQGFTIGFLGGRDLVAEKLAERLKKKYPKLKVAFAGSGGEVDQDGQFYLARGPASSQPHPTSSLVATSLRALDGAPRSLSPLASPDFAPSLNIPPTDILFVAFGQVKQEKWIAKNLNRYPIKVMIGVGGAFDYLSGSVLRAPILVQALGLEWLFRLLIQPWRIKRFSALVKFIFLVLLSK